MALVSIIVPVCNEQENIRLFYEQLVKSVPLPYELIWVEDGSTDHTLLEIDRICQLDQGVKCISLSKNFGHQNAILAGLQQVKGEVMVIMDGDLQHPPALIPEMIRLIGEGNDIVHTKRISTDKIHLFKRLSSSFYYWFLNSIADINIQESGSDFRAFDKKVLLVILGFQERDPFLRGIFSWIGFRSTLLEYTATARTHGKSKYSLGRMFSLGLNGITSFSVKPLRISFFGGLIVSGLSFLFLLYALYAHLKGATISGWTSLIVSVMFLGGLQLTFIGLIGIYVGQLLVETKKRPNFIIARTINC